MLHPDLMDVLAALTPQWMSLPGVEGTGEGRVGNEPCLIVMISRPVAEFMGKIPATVEGYPVVLRETGKIRALSRNR